MCFINHDLSKWIVLYISSSHKDIIANRAYIFGDGFNTYIKAIYAQPPVKKIYAKFFIEFWEMPEVQKSVSLILSIFCNYEPFRKDILYKSIYHDDVKLFDECIRLEKDNIPLIVSKIRNYSAWNILTNLNKYSQFENVDYGPTFVALLQVKNGEIEFNDVFNVKDTFTVKSWKMSGVYKFYQLFMSHEYVPSDLDGGVDKLNKYEFYTYTRNLLKYILIHQAKMDDMTMHEFFMLHNNFSLVYEYFNAEYKHMFSFKEKNEQRWVIDILHGKIKKNRNVLITLFKYKYLTVALYEQDPVTIFNYLVKKYEKLHADYTLFLMETVFNQCHKTDFYKVISSSFNGKMLKKERKKIYQTVKTPSRTFRRISFT